MSLCLIEQPHQVRRELVTHPLRHAPITTGLDSLVDAHLGVPTSSGVIRGAAHGPTLATVSLSDGKVSFKPWEELVDEVTEADRKLIAQARAAKSWKHLATGIEVTTAGYKDMYRCAYCQFLAFLAGQIRAHLKQHHQLPLPGVIICEPSRSHGARLSDRPQTRPHADDD